MEVKLDKNYPVAAGLGASWDVLSDMHELASCMPGAQLTEQVGPNQYKGQIKLKIGPATAAFSGDIEVLALEPDAKRIAFKGKGSDKSGSSASMELSATVSAAADDPNASTLAGTATIIVNGKFASMGGRLLSSVSDMILAQFAQNFSAKAAARSAAEPAAEVAAATEAMVNAADTPAMPAPAAAPAVPTEFNVGSSAWQFIRNFFARLFGRKI